MRYRIKIITYATGRKEFFAQYKKGLMWAGLGCDGDVYRSFDFECNSRESALTRIDKHFAGNTKIQTIEFEYINK